MTLLRKIGALIFAASSVLLALVAIIWGLSAGGVEHTVQHAREIENSFSLASGFVEGFKKTHGHLPSEAEFTGWADTQPDKAYSAKGMRLLTSQSQFPNEVLEKFGSSPQGGYIIEMWRGEWFEYFVSWANASTLEFDAKKFYFSGNAIGDGLAILALSIVVGFIGRSLWPRPTLRSSGTPQKRGAP
jgi:hypothetical protein